MLQIVTRWTWQICGHESYQTASGDIPGSMSQGQGLAGEIGSLCSSEVCAEDFNSQLNITGTS